LMGWVGTYPVRQPPVQALPFDAAHSVTILRSGIYRIVHAESVRRGRLRLAWRRRGRWLAGVQ